MLRNSLCKLLYHSRTTILIFVYHQLMSGPVGLAMIGSAQLSYGLVRNCCGRCAIHIKRESDCSSPTTISLTLYTEKTLIVIISMATGVELAFHVCVSAALLLFFSVSDFTIIVHS